MPAPEKLLFLNEVKHLPAPSNSDFLQIGLENWADQCRQNSEVSNVANELGNSKVGKQFLASIFGNSPFLSQCALTDLDFFIYLLRNGSKKALKFIYEELTKSALPEVDQASIMKALRIAKKRIALLAAAGDLANALSLSKVTRILSEFAGAATDLCLAHLLLEAHTKGDLVLPHPENPVKDSGLIILGMGKLGAFELNYSSDIDLIVFFDADKVVYTGRKFMDECFIRITKNLVKMMDERTADGYVFRMDLRLRPDPGATPIALPLIAAHVYYESQGQNWERAAMIKARPIAGDITAGEEFIDFLKPFVWRKYLDFAAIADIQAIKSQIHTHKGFSEIALDGHNIKIGRGGIREIEFFCQTQQLIEGGRNPVLRTSTTIGTLNALVDAGKVAPSVRDDLEKAYVFLRTLEHRLQMINDEQTQLLPEKIEALNQLGVFMGYNDSDLFRKELEETLNTVQTHYDNLFHFEESETHKVGRLVFTGSDEDPETLKSLTALGFSDASALSQIIREWHHGRYRATRTVRAQQLLTELMPAILEELSNTVNPDAAFMRFDAFLKKLPAGVQLFSLFSAHPSLLKLVAKIMGMAPELADQLSKNPLLLDGVLTSDFMSPLPPQTDLEEDLQMMLATARDFQDILDISRRWLNDLKFRVGVQILSNVNGGEKFGATVTAGESLTRIAEITMQSLLGQVEQELSAKHGHVPGGRFAVIAAGKLGSQEMTPRSDADLIFIYDLPDEDVLTDGAKPIPPGLYYTRLSQRFINSLSALTGEGMLYEVDMRLRPHGNSGPIALSLNGFKKYYLEDAWTWEHLALTRARALAGDKDLQLEADEVLSQIIRTKRDPAEVSKNLLDMQQRLHKEHSSTSNWALKTHPGGLMDLEFICQFLKLIHGKDHPEILKTNTILSFDEMAEHGILEPKTATKLVNAMALYLNLQGLIRLSLKDRLVTDDIPAALKEALCIAVNQPDFDQLSLHVTQTEHTVSEIFENIVGKQLSK
ncbi:MAG: bifunctional [glutamine synthetase] adenylyltransferase/[glutamine synthetase]-adenylyl-L-tyrosine phosphorylase [Pseudomonas marincola]